MSEICRLGLKIGLEPLSFNFNDLNPLDIPFINFLQLIAWFGTPLGDHSGAKTGVNWSKNRIFGYFVSIKPDKCAQMRQINSNVNIQPVPVYVTLNNIIGLLITIWDMRGPKSGGQGVK